MSKKKITKLDCFHNEYHLTYKGGKWYANKASWQAIHNNLQYLLLNVCTVQSNRVYIRASLSMNWNVALWPALSGALCVSGWLPRLPGSRSRVSWPSLLTSLLASEPLTLFTPTRHSSVQPHPWPCSLHTRGYTTSITHQGCQTSRIIPRPEVISSLPLARLSGMMMSRLQCEAVWGGCRPVTGVCWLSPLDSWLGTSHSGLRWASR